MSDYKFHFMFLLGRDLRLPQDEGLNHYFQAEVIQGLLQYYLMLNRKNPSDTNIFETLTTKLRLKVYIFNEFHRH